MSSRIIGIKEFDPDMIPPNSKTMYNPKQGGAKMVIIGKPGTGKSTMIASLLYAKKNIFPVGEVQSGTEDSNGFYGQIFPKSVIHDSLDISKIEDFIKRQKIAREHLENPWSILLLDDCTDDPSVLKKPLFQGIFKNGRHWKMWFILSLQYCMDVLPVIRTNVDFTFILRETNLKNRKALYENYAGIIPDYSIFCDIMDQITDDYTALVINNTSTSNSMEDCVFWYKADKKFADEKFLRTFKMGCKEFWDFHNERYNTISEK
jgi:hypothetical protein